MSTRPRRMHEVMRKEERAVEAKAVVAEPDGNVVRGRPGRRTVEERQQAVLEVLAGEASVDQVAPRLGVLPATVEGWRQDALYGEHVVQQE